MISLRYHVVTLVAVFLAVALGMLIGSAILQPRLVDQLKKQTQTQIAEIHQLEADKTSLQNDLGQMSAFTDSAMAWLTQGRLASTRIVMIAQEGVPDVVVGEAQRALASAGATVVATLSARSKLASQDPADRRQLADILGRPDAGAADLLRSAVSAIAARLAGPERRFPAANDVLHGLLSAGFLTPLGSQVTDATLGQIGGSAEAVVVLAGAEGDRSPMSPDAFSVPLVTALDRLGVPVAAGQSSGTSERFATILRQDVGDRVVTVDDLDVTIGGAALVLGLQQLMIEGRGGAYGTGDGAVLLPTPP